jgi:putative transposase
MRNYSPFQIMTARIRDTFPKKNRISPDDKLLAALLYHLRLSYRRVSFSFESLFTHVSVRLWYRKIGQNLPHPDRIARHIIAVDETKLKIEGKVVFVWSAIDVEKFEVLALKATGGRTELEAIFFVKDVLKYCLNRPSRPRGSRALVSTCIGTSWSTIQKVTFQSRNAIESWFHILKQKTKRFYNDFPFHSSMSSMASYLASFMRMQNILTARKIT